MMTTATLETNAPVQKRANVNTHIRVRANAREKQISFSHLHSEWLYDLISRDFMARIHAQSRRQIDSHEVKSQITDEQLNEVLARQRSDSFLILSTTFFSLHHSVCVRALCHEPFELMHVITLLFSPLCFCFWAVVAATLFLLAHFHSVLFILCSALGTRVVGFLRLNGPSECCIKCLRKTKPQSHPDHIFMCC